MGPHWNPALFLHSPSPTPIVYRPLTHFGRWNLLFRPTQCIPPMFRTRKNKLINHVGQYHMACHWTVCDEIDLSSVWDALYSLLEKMYLKIPCHVWDWDGEQGSQMDQRPLSQPRVYNNVAWLEARPVGLSCDRHPRCLPVHRVPTRLPLPRFPFQYFIFYF